MADFEIAKEMQRNGSLWACQCKIAVILNIKVVRTIVGDDDLVYTALESWSAVDHDEFSSIIVEVRVARYGTQTAIARKLSDNLKLKAEY